MYTNKKYKTNKGTYMPKVTGNPKCALITGKEPLTEKFAIHKKTVASDMAFPLIRFGKISERTTHVTGPTVAAYTAVKSKAKVNIQ